MDEYRYSHFDRGVFGEDVTFHGGPAPGELLPDFDLPTTHGGRLRRADLVGRPALVTFSSVTCPMTASASPILKKLHEEYSGQVAFVSVYVREAHPGERYPQADDDVRKMEHAKAYEARDEIPWRVAVDDVEGTFHRAMDGHTNAAWFIDAEGRVVFRSLWSNDERALRKGFDAVLAEPDERGKGALQRQSRVVPLLSAIGVMDEVLEAAGPSARLDVRRSMPPLYAFSRLARQFRPLSPLGRGLAASVTTLAASALLVTGVVGLLRGGGQKARRRVEARRGRPGKPRGLERKGMKPVARYLVEREVVRR